MKRFPDYIIVRRYRSKHEQLAEEIAQKREPDKQQRKRDTQQMRHVD